MKLEAIKDYAALIPQILEMRGDIEQHLQNNNNVTLTVGLIKESQDQIDLIEKDYKNVKFFKNDSVPLFTEKKGLLKKGLSDYNPNIGELLDEYHLYKILFIGE